MPASKVVACLAALLLLGHYTTCLIIPEELPTILSLIYSNIPPIKKGTDSRLGVGFRLGEHADFQIIVELGPQKYTDSIGNDVESKKKRATMLYAAMRGDLGPWAQAVAKYQMEEKIKKILEYYKESPEKLSKGNLNTTTKKTEGGDWLSKWKQQTSAVNSVDPSLIKETTTEDILPKVNRMKVVNKEISSDSRKKSAEADLTILKKLFDKNAN
ncbi:PREDICTED: uncharacterized protein LOC105359603 [Ceratosolen solmsi marchali]|uniref:Uncharacterized protein LOC105359603 n=1 Tax=Ceratosolen solmsi marchali TaxID=326594 RepID=A0AAJ6YC30_9HYME|nr:PREDICTED: uncharacterized protein LOC105359603 [Ceratosolen solmsi marchali]